MFTAYKVHFNLNEVATFEYAARLTLKLLIMSYSYYF
jgi:hypothetical protein